MTITPKNAATVTINGLDYARNTLTVTIVDSDKLRVTITATGEDLIGLTPWANLTNGATGLRFASQAAFLTAMGTAFGTYTPSGKAAAVGNTATAPGAAYVQAEAQAVLTELRALKTSLINAGILTP